MISQDNTTSGISLGHQRRYLSQQYTALMVPLHHTTGRINVGTTCGGTKASKYESDEHRINTYFRYCKVVAADPLKHAARAQRLQRVSVLLWVRAGPPAVRALEDLAGHAHVFDEPQLPLLVHNLDDVRLGVPRADVENNRRMNRKSSASKMPVMVEAAAYEKKVRLTMPLQVGIKD